MFEHQHDNETSTQSRLNRTCSREKIVSCDRFRPETCDVASAALIHHRAKSRWRIRNKVLKIFHPNHPFLSKHAIFLLSQALRLDGLLRVSQGISGACCSRHRASYAAEPQGLFPSLVDRKELPVIPFTHFSMPPRGAQIARYQKLAC